MPDSRHSTPAPHREPDESQGERPGSGRGWKIASAVAVLAAAVSMGVLGSLLFVGGDESKPADDVRACVPSRDFTADAKDTGDTCPPPGARAMAGLVQKSTKGGFTLRPARGGTLGEPIELSVREPDRPYIDVAHAQTHAALGQPICVFTEQVDGEEVVVYMNDACDPSTVDAEH